MTDRTCPKCNVVFKYPSFLKSHLKESARCKINSEDIVLFFNNIIKDKKQSKIQTEDIIQTEGKSQVKIKSEVEGKTKCNECGSSFTRHSSLNLHKKKSKCGKLQSAKELVKNEGIEKLDFKKISLLYPDIAEQIKKLQNDKPTLVNNTTNNNNTTINNNTNNTDNSKNLIINNTIIQHIMPFRYEDPRDIAIDDMIKILKSGEKAGLEILKLIYNKIENKNFYKNNIGKNNITYLTDNYDVDVCQEDELKKSLFDRSITLLHHMLYICKDKLRVNDIKDIYANIECISGMVRSEIYDNGLKNIMENEIRKHGKNSKDKITNYIKHLNCNPEEKQLALEMVNDMKVENNDVNIEFKQAITMGELNNKLGDPSKSGDLDYKKVYEDFTLKKFDDTSYNKYWKNRIKDEKKYIRSSKKANIRDIVELDKREEKIKMILNKMEEVHKEFVNGDNLKVEIPEEYKYVNKYIEA